jgi:hypothetical protein
MVQGGAWPGLNPTLLPEPGMTRSRGWRVQECILCRGEEGIFRKIYLYVVR